MSAPRWRAWLESPRAPWWLALLAFALSLPALGAGLCTEDWVLRDLALGAHRLNLYSTLESAADVREGRMAGILPWLTTPELRLSFFRPLASFWASFDFRVLGDAFWLMHLESLLLFTGLVLAVSRFLARVAPSALVAGLAALVYAVDDAHGHAVGWVANRNALLAALFGVLALAAHDRWRREGARRDGWLAPLFFALSLGSSELGLGTLGYVVAHAVFLDRGPRRALAVIPSGAVAAAWLALYRGLGHGARASGIYLDPLSAPLDFARELPGRLGALFLGLFAYPPADAWVTLGDGAHLALGLGGLFMVVLLALVLGPSARFALAGVVLSTLPATATSPSDRTLFLPGVGAALCVALVFDRALERRSLWLVAAPLAAVHLLLAPVLLPWRTLTMRRFHDQVAAGTASAYASVVSGDELVVALTAKDFYFCSLLRAMRANLERGPSPAVVCLAATRGEAVLERVDDNTLSLRVAEGYLAEPFNRLYRARSAPLGVGTRIYTGTLEAVVTEATPAGEPITVTFRFNWPLSSEKLRFVRWNGERFVPAPPPRAGERRLLSAPTASAAEAPPHAPR